MKELDGDDILTFKIKLETIRFDQFYHQPSICKSAIYKHNRDEFPTRNLIIQDRVGNIDEDEFFYLHGQGVKIIIPSNIIDTYTRLDVSLGLKLSGHTDTLTEASNLNDEFYKSGEMENEQQHRNALDKFSTQ